MEDNSVSYDPRSGGSARPSGAPRILARLPRVAIAPPEKITRTDAAENALHGLHHAAIDPTPQPVGAGDPMATVRFDTFATPAAPAEPVETPEPAASTTTTTATPVDDLEQESWLVRLEAAALPYERWVALAAVIAALCLTLTLLRSQPVSPTVESPAKGAFATTESVEKPAAPAFETLIVGADTPASPTGPVTAVGPRGLPLSDGPRAQLVQSVLPVTPAEAVNKNPAPLESPVVGDAYPRTATAVDPSGGELLGEPGGIRR